MNRRVSASGAAHPVNRAARRLQLAGAGGCQKSFSVGRSAGTRAWSAFCSATPPWTRRRDPLPRGKCVAELLHFADSPSVGCVTARPLGAGGHGLGAQATAPDAGWTRLRAVTHRVNHYCVEGWTAATQWTGVRVSELARLAGVLPDTEYVDFESFDSGYHERDMESAMHPQTLVAYGYHGRIARPAHGAPARLHSPVKLGYKAREISPRSYFCPPRPAGTGATGIRVVRGSERCLRMC